MLRQLLHLVLLIASSRWACGAPTMSAEPAAPPVVDLAGLPRLAGSVRSRRDTDGRAAG